MADETKRGRAPDAYGGQAGAGELEASVARGRDAGGMFGLLASVGLLVSLVDVVLAVPLLLIWWLA